MSATTDHNTDYAVYENAEACGCKVPDEDATPEAYDTWREDHPDGVTANEDTIQICHRTQLGTYCEECSHDNGDWTEHIIYCGWTTHEVMEAHQAAALSAAGFGLVADAKAEALEEAADDMDCLERLSSYPEESCNDEENAAVEAYDNATDNQEWLRSRAAALRGES